MTESTDQASAVDPKRFAGERAKLARLAAGLTLREVAGQIERSHATIRLYEKGTIRPSAEVLPEYARVLDVDLEDLYEPAPEGALPEATTEDGGAEPVRLHGLSGGRWVLGGSHQNRDTRDRRGNSGP